MDSPAYEAPTLTDIVLTVKSTWPLPWSGTDRPLPCAVPATVRSAVRCASVRCADAVTTAAEAVSSGGARPLFGPDPEFEPDWASAPKVPGLGCGLKTPVMARTAITPTTATSATAAYTSPLG